MSLMLLASLQRHSIKAKVTLFTLAIFVLSMVVLSLYASHELRTDVQQQMSQRQRAALSLLS
jgi:sensor histidine kinase regulating citrate/malate metabolism